jgi:alkyldihydroxyacetonephosphate synthase
MWDQITGRDHRPGYDRQRAEPFAVTLWAAQAGLNPARVLVILLRRP